MDDVILLSRLQFAVAVFFHFIFVPLTLGLSLLIALMETRYVRTGDATCTGIISMPETVADNTLQYKENLLFFQ